MTSKEINSVYQERLKRCPCCGGEPYFQHDVFALTEHLSICCRECGLHTRMFTPKMEMSAIEEAIETWNKRDGDCL